MSRKGSCLDDAVMEWGASLEVFKIEWLNYPSGLLCIACQSFASHFEVVKNIESYIYFYNYKRIDLEIGYVTPAQKMTELKKSSLKYVQV